MYEKLKTGQTISGLDGGLYKKQGVKATHKIEAKGRDFIVVRHISGIGQPMIISGKSLVKLTNKLKSYEFINNNWIYRGNNARKED